MRAGQAYGKHDDNNNYNNHHQEFGKKLVPSAS